MNVTRAFLPVMRKQRSGKIISISSSGGLTGFEYCTAYSAAKFGLEGWMEACRPSVEPFGIHTMTVNPGFLLHRAAHRGVNELRRRRDDHRRLQGAQRAASMNFGSGTL